MGGSGKENPTQKKRKVNGEINLKNIPKRQPIRTAKHRIGRFVKGEGTILKATGPEVRQALLENTQSTVMRSLGPHETQFCSQSSTFVEMEVDKNQITELNDQLGIVISHCTSLTERLDVMELRFKRWEPVWEETLNICGRAFFDKCVATFYETAQAHGYLKEDDNSFKKAWLNSAEATKFVAAGCYSMVIFGKRICITPDILERMRVFKLLSSGVSMTTAHQTTYLNVALSLTKNAFFQIPPVLDMFQELFASSPEEVVEAFESDCLNPFFLTRFKVY